jgi:hypothetical protein
VEIGDRAGIGVYKWSVNTFTNPYLVDIHHINSDNIKMDLRGTRWMRSNSFMQLMLEISGELL